MMNRENFIELPLKEQLLKKIHSYIKTVWANKIDQNKLNNWLENFENSNIDIDEKERLNMLFLLSKFSFLGETEIRVLLKSLFRDLFRRPIIQNIRRNHNDTLDLDLIKKEFEKELNLTRFVAIGGVSESGAMLMYPFRQENSLPEKQIVSQNDILKEVLIDNVTEKIISNETIVRYTFIDDFIGTGVQGKEKLKNDATILKDKKPDLELNYYVLVATEDGLKAIKDLNLFTSVKAVFILDATFKCFETDSRYYKLNIDGIDKNYAKDVALKYGKSLFRTQELGFGDCQLLFGFSHNTPDNTLPIFWGEDNNWKYIFKRFIKIKE